MMYDVDIKLQVADKKTFMNITPHIQQIVDSWKLKNGVVRLVSQHTTAGFIENEDESCLLNYDLPRALSKLGHKSRRGADPNDPDYYRHDDLAFRTENLIGGVDERANGYAHIYAMFVTNKSIEVDVVDGKLAMGEWGQIIFADFDDSGPRKVRTILARLHADYGERGEEIMVISSSNEMVEYSIS